MNKYEQALRDFIDSVVFGEEEALKIEDGQITLHLDKPEYLAIREALEAARDKKCHRGDDCDLIVAYMVGAKGFKSAIRKRDEYIKSLEEQLKEIEEIER